MGEDEWRYDWIHDSRRYVQIVDANKDEFRHRLLEHMHEVHGCGHTTRTYRPDADLPLVVDELIVSGYEDGRERSRLWLINVDGGLALFVVGRGSIDEPSVAEWLDAIQSAEARMGQRTAVQWHAVVVQAPRHAVETIIRVDGPQRVGDLVFESLGGTLVTDVIESLPGIGRGAFPSFAAPFRVSGVASCYSWEGDGAMATMRRLRVVSGLLSVAWDVPVYLREGPTDRPDIRWADAPGPLSGSAYRWREGDQQWTVPYVVPEWLPHADSRLAEDSTLAPALLMHHEAMMLQREHASLALIGYVSAIETIAQLTKGAPRCEVCHQVKGSGRRFREAIRDIVTEEDASNLAEVYEHRSATAHRSALHGRESAFGGLAMSLFLPQTVLRFELGVVRSARAVSRTLLWRHLGLGDSPE